MFAIALYSLDINHEAKPSSLSQYDLSYRFADVKRIVSVE